MLALNFTPFPALTTARFILRALALTDDNEIAALRSDERVNKFLHRPATTTIEEARQFIKKIIDAITRNESLYWVITSKDDNQLMGTICYWNISIEDDLAEIGYELHPDFQGKGVMQEVIAKVISYGVEEMRLKVITAFPFAGNDKSIKLLEKNDFKIDKDLKVIAEEGEDIADILCYSRKA
ncbi:ribosomal-protein-alanine N-acetyltransferase [Chitinophaga niastensis]|uniref:Ribosomal-protein-alanine N-acetyltransferase n=1 Tax=Chitinophaga niastensis TaxID=536980 RepID=A0A2P8HU49_CHINA|nr:GNAT family N-acetyltransferase [Chitinophaga niastensis]PSL49757.1 ribosomal-protein-alanine N-acetyltransferase [Chitinophaga niastensis]